jgi:hypothetical protein
VHLAPKVCLGSLLGGLVVLAAEVAPPYDAAVFDAGRANARDEQLLRLFPLEAAKETDVPLPAPVHVLAIGPDWKTLYAQPSRGKNIFQAPKGLLRIQFNPVRISLIPGSAGFVGIVSLAVWPAQDKLLVSGPYMSGSRAVCGVYEFMIADGTARKVLDTASCDLAEAWTYLSISPDNIHAVALHKNQLNLIDLVSGSVRPAGEGFEMAAWSPDGKWIAAREHTKEGKTVLLDAATFVRTRILESTEAQWSPDSRYLLAWKWLMLCGPETYSLEKVDITTGKGSIIESSKCRASGGNGGWLSTGIER